MELSHAFVAIALQFWTDLLLQVTDATLHTYLQWNQLPLHLQMQFDTMKVCLKSVMLFYALGFAGSNACQCHFNLWQRETSSLVVPIVYTLALQVFLKHCQ